MLFPTYVITETISCTKSKYTNSNMLCNDCRDMRVYLQGHKMKFGFKINRKVYSIKGSRRVCYQIKKYGWSEKMLLWRSKELGEKINYLYEFITTSSTEKLDSFFLGKENVLIEKNMFISS